MFVGLLKKPPSMRTMCGFENTTPPWNVVSLGNAGRCVKKAQHEPFGLWGSKNTWLSCWTNETTKLDMLPLLLVALNQNPRASSACLRRARWSSSEMRTTYLAKYNISIEILCIVGSCLLFSQGRNKCKFEIRDTQWSSERRARAVPYTKIH